MKILKPLLLIILGFTLLSSNCKKDNQAPVSELSKLPPATQTGANTFGCLVNGIAFIPGGPVLSSGQTQCNYIYTAGGFYLTVAADNKSNLTKQVVIRTDSLAITEGQIIKLTSYNVKGKANGDYTIFNDPYYDYYYYTNEILTGQLTITKFDQVKQIVSGTFYFTAIRSVGDTIKITNGRFDMLYTL